MKRITQKSLPDDVYDILLKELSKGRWEAGTPLSIDGLASFLGVSPTPVREALARLESTGLVRREARRGYRVSPPMTRQQACELVDARIVLETGAMARAMENPTNLLADLERAYEAHETAVTDLKHARRDHNLDALAQYFANDWQFHSAILKHCNNRYLELLVESLGFRAHRMRQAVGSGVTDEDVALAEHKDILDAVRSGDTQRAVEAMSAHLNRLLDRVKQEPESDQPHIETD